MTRTVGNLKDEVAGLLQGVDLDNVTDLNGGLQRAFRNFVQLANVPEASWRLNLSLYNGVYDYASPTNIFGGSFQDLRPQGISRSPIDEVTKQPIELFDLTKVFNSGGYQVTFEFNKGVGIMRVAQSVAPAKITLDGMNSTTGWTAGGNASGLALDNTVYYQSPAALRFNLAAAGSQGYIEKAITSMNLTSYQGVGVVFLAVRIPTSASAVTSIGVRLGSDSSNYYQVTNTTGFLGAWTIDEYLLIALDLATATTTGSPVITAIDYARIFFNYDGTALTNVRVGAFFIALPSPHTLIYSSASIFQVVSTGVISNTITTDDDVVLLGDAAWNVYVHECAKTIALQVGGTMGSGVVATLNQILNGVRAPRTGAIIQQGLYDRYNANNPSEDIRQVGSYY